MLVEIVESNRSLKRKEGKERKRKGRKQRVLKVGLCFLHQFLEKLWSKAQEGELSWAKHQES